MNRYREHKPPASLAPYVECFWSIDPGNALPDYPVLPDGCVDIVYAPTLANGLQLVGAMTKTVKFALPAEEFRAGVRFRPGMASSFVSLRGRESLNRVVPLGDIWGVSARELEKQIEDSRSSQHAIALLEAHLIDPEEPGIVQQIGAHIVKAKGQVRIDDLAFSAGMSARQLRRLFVEQIGLSPKHFCRVIRFRHSLARLNRTRRGDWTQLALECGYYDQAHFINEFQKLSGYSPSEFTALRR